MHIHLQTRGLNAFVEWPMLTSLRSHSGVQQSRENQACFLTFFIRLHWCELDRFSLESRRQRGGAFQQLTAQLPCPQPSQGTPLILQGTVPCSCQLTNAFCSRRKKSSIVLREFQLFLKYPFTSTSGHTMSQFDT